MMLGVHFLSSCSGKSSSKSSGGGGGSGGTSEVEVSGTISDDEPLDFVQSSQSVSISGVNLTSSFSYIVSAYSLEPRGLKKLIFTGSFAEPKFSFKSSVARQYIVIEITRMPDGGQFGGVLPPPMRSSHAKTRINRTSTIAAKMASIIAERAVTGDEAAKSALSTNSISVTDLLTAAQSVSRTISEQKSKGSGSAIDLSTLAIKIATKSNERLSALAAEGQNAESVAAKISNKAYESVFGSNAETVSPGVLAHRTNLDLGTSTAAIQDVAYAAIKDLGSDSGKFVDEAFRVESTNYRQASSESAAVAAESAVTSEFSAKFDSCKDNISACASVSYTPPQASLSGGGSTSSVEVCTRDGQVGCLTTAAFKAADVSNISAGNIKSGVTIAGQLGDYTGIAPDPWDVRVGKTVNGVAGKLKVNCRNRINSEVYNYDGAIGSIGQGGHTASSTDFDIWDTIDDSMGNPPSVVSGWESNDCSGVDTAELSTDDDKVWKDVTTTNGTTASTCTATPANCTMQDKITGLSWSKLQASAAWNTAWSHCQSLNYNGQTGWRLPTQKELMEAYTHGIRTVPNTSWISFEDMTNGPFWSGSSHSYETGEAWYVYLSYGGGVVDGKFYTGQVVCVR
jgi:hypothetical protein